MSNTKNQFMHPILEDKAFNDALDRLTDTLQEVAVFWRSPRQHLFSRPTYLVIWLKNDLGASKTAIKWLLPLCTMTTTRNLAQFIFGRDLSPIEELGTRPVSAFVRSMLFEKKYSVDEVRKVLIDDLGYEKKIARPLVRRIEREWDKNGAIFSENSEATMFKDISFV